MSLPHAAAADKAKRQHEDLPLERRSADVIPESYQIVGVDLRALARRNVALALLEHDPSIEAPVCQVAEDTGKVDIDRAPSELLEFASAPVLEVDVTQAVPVLVDDGQRILVDEGDVGRVQAEAQGFS